MRKLSFLPCVTLLIAATPGNSAPPNVASQASPSDSQLVVNLSGGQAPAASQNYQDKKVCRQLPSSTSRLPNRVCLTEKEWKQVEDEVSH